MDSSWRRRRLFACALLACGAVAALLYAHAPTRVIGAAMLMFGLGGCLAGLAGIIYPPTVLDPTMDHSKLDRGQLLREVATWPALVGLLCWIAGIAIGVHLLGSRG